MIVHSESHAHVVKEMENISTKPLTAKDRRMYLRKLMTSEFQSRVQPLQELKYELQKIQDEYCQELFELEKRYHEESQNLYEQREKIINGSYEPKKDEEIEENWQQQPFEVDLLEYAKFYEKSQKLPTDCVGVPNFWFHIFTTSETLSQIVYKADLEALKFLANVSIDYDSKSFTLEFYFKKNPYFLNNLLTKRYFLRNKLDEDDDPWGFEGFRIYKCNGCRIHWKRDQNLTFKIVQKQNGKQKFVPLASFFNFFDPPEIDTENVSDIDDETREILNLHFKIGNFLREEIIPKALLYFTGEIVDDLDDGDESLDSDEDCADGPVTIREDDKHFANVARVLRKINWN